LQPIFYRGVFSDGGKLASGTWRTDSITPRFIADERVLEMRIPGGTGRWWMQREQTRDGIQAAPPNGVWAAYSQFQKKK
jgi:hypothetical protein